MARTASSVIEELLAHPKFGTGIGFRRLSLLLRPLFETAWGRRFSAIKITGSNGKGSVAALTHSILRSLGANCGRYTSPHLVRFNERIVIGGTDISDADLVAASAWLAPALARVAAELPGDAFGSFELITALCVRAFLDAGLTTGVMEAGIGGRYDPVRLVPGDLVALTSLDLEHTELLGKTKELIAYDKLDLCPDGGTVVAVRRDDDLWARIAAYCDLRRITLVNAGDRWAVELAPGAPAAALDHMSVRVTSAAHRAHLAVPLVGTFQLDNMSVACTLAELWAARHRPGLSTEAVAGAIADGLRSTRWPGRFEQISTDPVVIIDVGHSPDACARMVQSVGTFLPGHKLLLVTGVSADKAVEGILEVLVPVADEVICTRAYHKGEAVPRIGERVRRLAPSKVVREAGTIEEAAVLARQIARAQGMTVLVAGGLFLATEFRAAWDGSDPRLLRFY